MQTWFQRRVDRHGYRQMNGWLETSISAMHHNDGFGIDSNLLACVKSVSLLTLISSHTRARARSHTHTHTHTHTIARAYTAPIHYRSLHRFGDDNTFDKSTASLAKKRHSQPSERHNEILTEQGSEPQKVMSSVPK